MNAPAHASSATIGTAGFTFVAAAMFRAESANTGGTRSSGNGANASTTTSSSGVAPLAESIAGAARDRPLRGGALRGAASPADRPEAIVASISGVLEPDASGSVHKRGTSARLVAQAPPPARRRLAANAARFSVAFRVPFAAPAIFSASALRAASPYGVPAVDPTEAGT